MSSFVGHLKKLDVYRTIPKDLTEQTATGASVSIVAALIISLLFFSELATFLTVTVRHEMFVDHGLSASSLSSGNAALDESANLMKINFNITLPRMACAITHVQVQDVLGSNIDVESKIHKYRTDSLGRLRFNEVSGVPLSGDYGVAKDQLLEGCCVEGHLLVKKVPGNFHFSSNAHPDVLQMFFLGAAPGQAHKGIGGNLNTSHIINELWFGETKELAEIAALSEGSMQTALAPLNGGTKWSLESEVKGGNEKSYEYFIKVIPTEYKKLNGALTHTYQYVSNSNGIIGRFRMPTIFFRWDVEPITVRFVQKSTSFAHFFVQCCAIIGGMFTVLGVIHQIIKSTLKAFTKSASVAASVNLK